MQCLRCPSGCWEKEEVFWLSCLWSWWWQQVWHHPVGVDAFPAQCGMGVKGGGAGNNSAQLLRAL